MEKQTTQEQLYDVWVNKVYDYLTAVGPKIDRCTSVLQSKPVLDNNLGVVFLGFGPTGDVNYVHVDKKRFYYGSPFFLTDKNEWRVWTKLYEAFDQIKYLNPLTEGNYQFMNATYFCAENTAKLKDELKLLEIDIRYEDVQKQCLEFTIELIHHILKPKCIVCFSVKDCYNPLKAQFKFDKEEVLTPTNKDKKPNKHIINKALWGKIPVYGMTHPSAAISNEDWDGIVRVFKKEMEQLGI